jgi:molybdate transport system substrate-binding protein
VRRWICLPLTLLAALASFTPGQAVAGSPQRELIVAAAANLSFALREIAPAFEREQQVKVALTLGSTAQLAQQILHGAPYDVLFAADAASVEDLRTKGAVLPDSVEAYASGQIVLASMRGRSAPSGLRDLTRNEVKRIAIANPVHAPYGKAAQEALEKTGLWSEVQSKLVYGENVGQALQFLQTGNVDVAIIPLSLARAVEIPHILIDQALYRPIIQFVGVSARSKTPDLARAFIRFVTGPPGRPVMKRLGYLLPGEF